MALSGSTLTMPGPRSATESRATPTTGLVAVASATGQWFTSERGTRWWFDSGSLALDLAHTAPLADDGQHAVCAVRSVVDGRDLDAWLAPRLACSPASPRDVVDVLVLRDAIGHLALASARGLRLRPGDVDVVNLAASVADVPPRLGGGSRQAGRTLARPGQALASIAREAVAVFSGERAGRIRVCDAPTCDLVYLDTSRAATRRWCSMERCGNRSKVRAHRARRAALSSE